MNKLDSLLNIPHFTSETISQFKDIFSYVNPKEIQTFPYILSIDFIHYLPNILTNPHKQTILFATPSMKEKIVNGQIERDVNSKKLINDICFGNSILLLDIISQHLNIQAAATDLFLNIQRTLSDHMQIDQLLQEMYFSNPQEKMFSVEKFLSKKYFETKDIMFLIIINIPFKQLKEMAKDPTPIFKSYQGFFIEACDLLSQKDNNE